MGMGKFTRRGSHYWEFLESPFMLSTKFTSAFRSKKQGIRPYDHQVTHYWLPSIDSVVCMLPIADVSPFCEGPFSEGYDCFKGGYVHVCGYKIWILFVYTVYIYMIFEGHHVVDECHEYYMIKNSAGTSISSHHITMHLWIRFTASARQWYTFFKETRWAHRRTAEVQHLRTNNTCNFSLG